jgi:hypothetical protein
VSLAILLSLTLSGCAFPSGGSSPIMVTAKTITLEWDPPSVEFLFGPLAIPFYHVYIRHHGSPNWIFCGQVTATANPQIQLHHSDYGNGTYDFAVSAVDTLGQESALHTSLDASASPYGGWHIDWVNADQ